MRNNTYLIAGCLGMAWVAGAVGLHAFCGWSWLLIAAFALLGLFAGMGLYWIIYAPAKEINMETTMPTINDPWKLSQAEWNHLVRQHPEAWQYCRCTGDRTVHVLRDGKWVCAACEQRAQERARRH